MQKPKVDRDLTHIKKQPNKITLTNAIKSSDKANESDDWGEVFSMESTLEDLAAVVNFDSNQNHGANGSHRSQAATKRRKPANQNQDAKSYTFDLFE